MVQVILTLQIVSEVLGYLKTQWSQIEKSSIYFHSSPRQCGPWASLRCTHLWTKQFLRGRHASPPSGPSHLCCRHFCCVFGVSAVPKMLWKCSISLLLYSLHRHCLSLTIFQLKCLLCHPRQGIHFLFPPEIGYTYSHSLVLLLK